MGHDASRSSQRETTFVLSDAVGLPPLKSVVRVLISHAEPLVLSCLALPCLILCGRRLKTTHLPIYHVISFSQRTLHTIV